MNIQIFYDDLLLSSFILAAIVLSPCSFLPRLTGAHQKGWGRKSGTNWHGCNGIAFPVVLCGLFPGREKSSAVPLIFLVLWEAHYIHRAFIYPFSLRGNRRMRYR